MLAAVSWLLTCLFFAALNLALLPFKTHMSLSEAETQPKNPMSAWGFPLLLSRAGLEVPAQECQRFACSGGGVKHSCQTLLLLKVSTVGVGFSSGLLWGGGGAAVCVPRVTTQTHQHSYSLVKMHSDVLHKTGAGLCLGHTHTLSTCVYRASHQALNIL